MSDQDPGPGPEYFEQEGPLRIPPAAHAASEPPEDDEIDSDVELAEPPEGYEIDGLSDGG